MKRRSHPIERAHRNNYKARISRRGSRLHPAIRQDKPWWWRDADLRAFCQGTQAPAPRYVHRGPY